MEQPARQLCSQNKALAPSLTSTKTEASKKACAIRSAGNWNVAHILSGYVRASQSHRRRRVTPKVSMFGRPKPTKWVGPSQKKYWICDEVFVTNSKNIANVVPSMMICEFSSQICKLPIWAQIPVQFLWWTSATVTLDPKRYLREFRSILKPSARKSMQKLSFGTKCTIWIPNFQKKCFARNTSIYSIRPKWSEDQRVSSWVRVRILKGHHINHIEINLHFVSKASLWSWCSRTMASSPNYYVRFQSKFSIQSEHQQVDALKRQGRTLNYISLVSKSLSCTSFMYLH